MRGQERQHFCDTCRSTPRETTPHFPTPTADYMRQWEGGAIVWPWVVLGAVALMCLLGRVIA